MSVSLFSHDTLFFLIPSVLVMDSKFCVHVYVVIHVAADFLVVHCSISVHHLLTFAVCSSCHVLFLQVNVRLVFITDAVFKSATVVHVSSSFLYLS